MTAVWTQFCYVFMDGISRSLASLQFSFGASQDFFKQSKTQLATLFSEQWISKKGLLTCKLWVLLKILVMRLPLPREQCFNFWARDCRCLTVRCYTSIQSARYWNHDIHLPIVFGDPHFLISCFSKELVHCWLVQGWLNWSLVIPTGYWTGVRNIEYFLLELCFMLDSPLRELVSVQVLTSTVLLKLKWGMLILNVVFSLFFDIYQSACNCNGLFTDECWTTNHIVLVLYKNHWEFPIHKNIIPIMLNW